MLSNMMAVGQYVAKVEERSGMGTRDKRRVTFLHIDMIADSSKRWYALLHIRANMHASGDDDDDKTFPSFDPPYGRNVLPRDGSSGMMTNAAQQDAEELILRFTFNGPTKSPNQQEHELCSSVSCSCDFVGVTLSSS